MVHLTGMPGRRLPLAQLAAWHICMKIQALELYIGTSSPATSCWNMILHQKFQILDWPEQHWMRGTNTSQHTLWEHLGMKFLHLYT